MNQNIINRVKKEASHIIETEKTVREIAKVFNVSKSTVHKDLYERLKIINKYDYLKVKKILEYHTKIRHLRGGESTKKKYQNLTNKVKNSVWYVIIKAVKERE